MQRPFSSVFPLLFGLVIAFASTTIAQTEATPETEPNSDGGDPAVEGIPLQFGDDVTKPFEPKTPRSDATDKQIDAVAHYMAGRVLEKRQKFEEAYRSYRQAIQLDPDSAAAHKAIVPIAFRLGRTKDGEKYALKAVQLDPEDYELLQQLGTLMAGQRKFIDAVDFFERAANAKTLDQNSPTRVLLARSLAILHGAIGNMEKAADEYEIIFEAIKAPRDFSLNYTARARLLEDDITNYEKIGQVFLEVERFEKAGEAFERAAESRRGNPGVLNYFLARVYYETERYEDAVQKLNAYFAEKLTDQGRKPYELLEQIYEKTEADENYLARLEEIASADPENEMLQYTLGEAYVDADKLKEAEEIFRNVLERGPSPESQLGLAMIFRKQNRVNDYVEMLANAVPQSLALDSVADELQRAGEDKTFAKALSDWGSERLAEMEVKPALLLGMITSDAELTDSATAFLRRALESARQTQLSTVYDRLGLHLLLAEDYIGAAKLYERAANDPVLSDEKLQNLYRLTQAWELGGETEKALAAIREAREIRDLPLLHYQEGWVYFHARRWEPAIRIFKEVIAKSDRFPDVKRRAQFSLSTAYVQAGDVEKGEQVLEDAYAENPDDPGVNNDLGYLYADQGKNLERAEQMIRKAVAAEPENGAYLDSLGWVLYKRGKYEEALEAMDKVLKTDSAEDSTILDHYGDVLKALGRDAEALKYWKEALANSKSETSPDADMVRKLREKIKAADGETQTKDADTPDETSEKPSN